MAKSPRVIFKYKRLAEGEWQIEAHCPGAEIRHIKGFTSKTEVDEWLQGRIDWLRSQGYACGQGGRKPVLPVHIFFRAMGTPDQLR